MDPNAALNEYQSAKDEYKNFVSGTSGFSARLKDDILGALRDNQDLIAQVTAGEEGYYNAPTEARAEYEGVFNPFQREALVGRATGMARQGWTMPQSILEQRMGNVKDIVGSATQGYKEDIANKQTLAEMSWREYQQAMDEQQSSKSKTSKSDLKTHINTALGILEEADIMASGKDSADKKLADWEDDVAYKRIAAYAETYGIDPDELYNTAMNIGGYDYWKPEEKKKNTWWNPFD